LKISKISDIFERYIQYISAIYIEPTLVIVGRNGDCCYNCCVCSALETGLGTLLASVEKTVESAVNAQRAAAKAVNAHTDVLKKAMDVSSLSQSVTMSTC